jgi:flagellar basal body-associated protein FliL
LASDIVTKTTSSNKSETSSKGMESLMAEIQKGRAEQMKAVGDAITDVTKAQAEAMGGGMNQLLPIIGAMMLFGGGAGGGGGMMSKILMFVGIALIAYFALAYFMGFWPFNKSDEPEKKIYTPDMPMARFSSLGGPYKGIQPLKLGQKFKSANPYSKGATLKI